jgi:hypothetical protein
VFERTIDHARHGPAVHYQDRQLYAACLGGRRLGYDTSVDRDAFGWSRRRGMSVSATGSPASSHAIRVGATTFDHRST